MLDIIDIGLFVSLGGRNVVLDRRDSTAGLSTVPKLSYTGDRDSWYSDPLDSSDGRLGLLCRCYCLLLLRSSDIRVLRGVKS